jgi:dienelactone hydrolase
VNTPHRPAEVRAGNGPPGPVEPAPLRTRHPFVFIAVVLVLGTVATAVGAGIGVRHLQKTGLSVMTVAGLALLVVGLLALGYAAVVGWRRLRRWWRLAMVPVAVVVLQVAFCGAFAVMVTVVPPTTLGSDTPAAKGLEYRDVTFSTSDGVKLSAWYVPSRDGAAVVLRHGSGSIRTATLDQAAVLARHGYGVLLVDARGHGRSDGAGMDLGWYGDADTIASVTYLTRRPDVSPDRIGVVGLSMGGEEAIGAAAADSRIKAVVAEGATGRTAADIEALRTDGAGSVLPRVVDRFTYGLVDLLTGAAPPDPLRAAVAEAEQAELLLVTAGQLPDEGRAAESFRSAAPDRVTVWEVPDASHTGGLATAPREWESRVVGFLDAALAPPPAQGR